MVVGTTKTGEKVNLGTITIVGTNQSSYPSGGPTVPGSSTGIGSTFTPSQTGTYRATTGGGSSSVPKSPQVYSSQLLQQNFTSAAERDKAENIYRQEQARQQQIAFSKTGGLVAPGQTSPYFKVRTQDVKTDSQAIRQAVGMADQTARQNISTSTQKISSGFFGATRDIEVINTSQGKYYGINVGGKEGYVDEKTFKQYEATGTWKTDTQFLSRQEVISGTVSSSKQAQRDAQLKSDLAEEAAFQQLSYFIGGGGAQITGLVTNVGTRVVSRLLGPTLVSAGAGVSSAAAKAQQLFNPFGQTSFSQAGRLVVGGTKVSVSEGTKKIAKEGLKFGASQVASGTGYFLSSQAPDAARQLYDAQNPDKAKKFSQFETQQDYDIVARSYTAMQVELLGGQKETSGYYTADKEKKQSVWVEPKTETVQGKVDPLTGFVYQAVPVTRLTNPDAIKTWEKRLVEEYKEDPRYQALSASEKKEFIEYKKGKELAYAQAGGFVGQVGTEISSEIGSSGAHSVFFDTLSGGQSSALRSAGARIILTLPYGTTEGGMQPVLEASSERRVAETNQILYGMGAGAVTSSLFAGVPEYLRVSAKPGAKTAMKEVAETVGKKTTKKTIKETSQSAAEGMAPPWLKNITATGTEYAGYALDPLEKIGDLLALPAKKGIGVSTITITPAQTLTSTSVKTQTDTKSKTKTDDTSQIMTGGIVDVLASVDTNTDNKRGRGKTDTDTDSKTDTDNDDGKGGKIDTDSDSDTDTDSDADTDTDSKTDTTTGALTGVNTLTSTAVIVPQRGFGLPGFFPIGMGARGQIRQQTRIYDELAAAGKRFEQISGLHFTQQPVRGVKPKSVLIDGKNYKIGKRLK